MDPKQSFHGITQVYASLSKSRFGSWTYVSLRSLGIRRRREILCEASVENMCFGCNPGERACQQMLCAQHELSIVVFACNPGGRACVQVLRAGQLLIVRLFQFEHDGLGTLATSSAGFQSI